MQRQITTPLMEHQHSIHAGVDGYSDPAPESATVRVLTTIQQDGKRDAYQIELDALTRQLMRAACVKQQIVMPSDDKISAISWACWRRQAAILVALSLSDVEGKAKAETIRDIADEHCQDDCFGHEARIARAAIERFTQLIREAGER